MERSTAYGRPGILRKFEGLPIRIVVLEDEAPVREEGVTPPADKIKQSV